MSPAERARWLRTAAAWIPTLPPFVNSEGGAAVVLAGLERLAQAEQSPLIFRSLGDHRWLIGSAAPREFTCGLLGLRAAWVAINAGRGEAVLASALVHPGARQAGTTVRAAIRGAAVRWVQRDTGARDLAAAFCSVVVERGVLRYRPAYGARPIITRDN